MYACHGGPGGTLNIRWFPARYQPGQTYRLTVGGGSVDNFNCSVRVGRGAANAGLITADFGTETYWDTVETNGVHALAPCDTCNFLWTAPPAGTDTVRLYFSGTQWYGDYSNDSVLVSAEFTGVEEERELLLSGSGAFGLRMMGASPVRGYVTLAYRANGVGSTELRIYDLRGRLVRSYVLSGHAGLLRWDGRDASGHLVPEGFYFFRLEQGPRCATCKALLIR
jgi:hypothetical protein